MTTPGNRGALEGVRVVDTSTTVAGAWCSRLLAGLGADVIVVEPPEGHPIRHLAPFAEDGTSAPAAYLLADKRSVQLDATGEQGLAAVRRLAAGADIVVSSSTPSALEARRLRFADLEAPGLVMVHVTPHGMTGPLAEVPGNDLTVAARSGWASINGMDGRDPLKPAAWQSSYCAGVMAAGSAVAALRYRDAHGVGQEVDVAETEVMTGTFAPALLRSEYEGRLPARPKEMNITEGPVPVADGYFALTLSRAHFWRDAMNLLELPDLAEDPRWESSAYRREHHAEYTERVQERMTHWNKMDLFDELAIRRVVAGPVLSMSELLENVHLRERGFWVRPLEDPTAPEFAGAPFKLSATPFSLRTTAPEVGEHTDSIANVEVDA